MDRIPTYRLHKATGQAYTRVRGKCYYFGKFGTAESKAKYEEWLARYLMNGRRVSPKKSAITINHIAAAYLEWARERFKKRGKPTGQLNRIKIALRPLRELFGDLPAEDFNLPCFERVQQRMVELEWTRSYCNTCSSILRSVFVWAGAREFISMERAMRVKAAPGLARGQTAAREGKRIEPVEETRVLQTLPHLGRIPRAMVQVQWLAGMRPVEVCLMRPCDIDRSREPWVYKPHSHKNEHHNQERLIFLGPQAREALLPFVAHRVLLGQHEGYLFSPREALEDGVVKTGRKVLRRVVRPGEHYTTHGYTQAVERACERAGVSKWTPLQLRHSRATETRSKYGPDAAKAQLGHRSLQSTQIYAELDQAKAARVAEETG